MAQAVTTMTAVGAGRLRRSGTLLSRLYASTVLPRLIDLSMRTTAIERERARWVSRASGRVLEVGFGSGLNLKHYGATVERLDALDPSVALWRLSAPRRADAQFPLAFTEGHAEDLPFETSSFDMIVMTWTLCSTSAAELALREMRRVLRRQGRLIFIEHGRAPDASVQRWQARITPIWKRVAGGCQLGLDINGLLTEAGFEISSLETGYGEGPRPFTLLYRGLAIGPG